MALTGIVHVEWLNENANRRYPFLDEASLADTTGTITLPTELIVDLTFPLQAFVSYDLTKFYLSALTVFDGGVILSFSYDGAVFATRAITYAEHTENQSYYLEGSGSFADSVGRITIGRMDEVKRIGGSYSFAPSAAPLLPTIFRPTIRGVSSLRVVNANNEQSDLLYGDIELLAGANISIEVSGSSPPQIKISAVNNPAWDASCACADTVPAQCITTINGIHPDDTGNFSLASDGCITLDAATNGLKLTDTCATPCCGCSEISTLQEEVQRLAAQLTTQEAFAQRAMSNVEQLQTAVLSSRTGTCS